MDPATVGLVAFAAMLILLAIRIPIAFALTGVAMIAAFTILASGPGLSCQSAPSGPPHHWCFPTRLIWYTLSTCR